MKRAVIDLGTNSMRLLILTDEEIENRKNKRPELIEKIIVSTRIGRGVSETGKLSEDAIVDNIRALGNFKERATKLGAKTLTVVATEAVRKANNKEEFFKRTKDLTGIVVNTIPGEKEAEFGFEGATMGIDRSGAMIVMDTGGGSTEYSIGTRENLADVISTNLGCVRILEKYQEEDGLNIEKAVDFIGKGLDLVDEMMRKNSFDYIGGSNNYNDVEIDSDKLFLDSDKSISKVSLVSIGGTATTLSAISQDLDKYSPDMVNGDELSFDEVKKLFDRLNGSNVDTRLQIPTLQPERADIIPSGALILRESMKRFGAEVVLVSEFDNLDGLSMHLDEFESIEL